MNEFFENAGEDYEVPKGESKYMKFEQGDNKFRILQKPIFGWEGWKIIDGKDTPVRFKMEEKPVDLREFKEQRLSHFWAMVVWNFEHKSIEVLEITQKTIQKTIESLARNEDWGSPLGYSITVNREGEKLETKYTVTPSPIKETPQEVTKAFEELKDFDITRLFSNGDPFSSEVKD